MATYFVVADRDPHKQGQSLVPIASYVPSPLGDHDHSGDVGDGGTFDAANLTSDAAGDNYVLAADGVGGAAWEPLGGGAAVSILDHFTDANDTSLDAHTPDEHPVGSVWVEDIGTFEIQSNQANTPNGNAREVAVIDSTVANGTLTCNVKVGVAADNDEVGIVFRFIDSDNYWWFELQDSTDAGDRSVNVWKKVAGVDSNEAYELFPFDRTVAYELQVVLSGTSIKCYVDDVLKADITSAVHQAGTSVGLVAYHDITAIWDDFTFVGVGAGGIPIDHGALTGLADDDHTQYIKHSLATAISDFLVASGAGAFVKKTLAEVKAILGLGTAAYTAATDYAVAAKGVTNGDSHDHAGGDGAQIDHGGLGGLGDDDHTQYQKESEKSQASGYASLDAGTKVPTAELGGVGADNTKYLRGDQSWQVPAGGGDVATDAIWDAKGDLAAGTGANTAAKVVVGADGKYLKADSGAAAGVSWDNPPGSGDVLWAAIQASELANEVMNFPSLEGADNVQPEWWEEGDANATLTEVDIAGEAGITESWERCHKLVTIADAKYSYQRYTYADQPRLKLGKTISAIFAVWTAGGVAARICLQSSVGSLGVSSDTVAAAWTILTVNGVVLDGTYVDIRCEVDSGTAYFVPLGLHVGARAVPLAPRGLNYRAKPTRPTIEDLTGSGGKAFADVDFTASTSPLAVRVGCNILMVDSAEEYRYGIRPNGSALASGGGNVRFGWLNNTAISVVCQYLAHIVDDGQILETELIRVPGAGTIGGCYLVLLEWWEWA